jgi:hypothetical protein
MATDATDAVNTDPLSGFFWANNPNVNQQLRQRIALAMMTSKGKGYPKTLGEGLTAIGDSLGEIGMARRLEQGDLAQQSAARAVAGGGVTAPYAPPGDEAPAVSAINSALSPDAGAGAGASAAPAAAPNRIYSNDEPSPLDPPVGADRTKMLATILGEENTVPGQAGVANVIRNRAIDGGYGGNTPGAVVTARNQFEPWNTEAGRGRMAQALSDPRQVAAADQAIRGAYGEGGRAPEDPTAGKTMFYGPDAQRALGRPPPSWAKGPGQTLGESAFYNGKPNRPAVDPRATIANTLLQRPGVPQTNPTEEAASPPDGGQAMALRAPDAGIAPAPPSPPQIRSAPQQLAQAAPGPDYVTPQSQPPKPPPQIPISRREQELTVAAQANPYLAPVLAQEQAKRAFQQDLLNKKYEADLRQHETLLTKREDQLATAAQRGVTYEEARRKLNKPDLQELDGKMERDPVSGIWSVPKLAAPADPNSPPQVKMSGEQAKAQKFHSWTRLAEDQFEGKDKILAEGYGQRALGQVPFVGNKLQGAQYRQAANAAERWVQGFMRDISGAAIGTEEFNKHMRTFFPQPGDGDKEIAEKKAARENATFGMYTASGPGRAISDWEDGQRRAIRTARDATVEKEMEGAPKIVGKILKDDKTHKRRTWTGTRWEDL